MFQVEARRSIKINDYTFYLHGIQYKTYLSTIIDFSIKLSEEIAFVGDHGGLWN